jgi:hypothetical protein
VPRVAARPGPAVHLLARPPLDNVLDQSGADPGAGALRPRSGLEGKSTGCHSVRKRASACRSGARWPLRLARACRGDRRARCAASENRGPVERRRTTSHAHGSLSRASQAASRRSRVRDSTCRRSSRKNTRAVTSPNSKCPINHGRAASASAALDFSIPHIRLLYPFKQCPEAIFVRSRHFLFPFYPHDVEVRFPYSVWA